MSANYKLKMYQGATFERVIQWKDSTGTVIPLIGFTARFTVRARAYNGDVALNLTTENGGITINTTTNKLTIKATAIQTNSTNMPNDNYLYVLELKDGVNNEYRLMYGNVNFIQEVEGV